VDRKIKFCFTAANSPKVDVVNKSVKKKLFLFLDS
jgi:hypothetical protein